MSAEVADRTVTLKEVVVARRARRRELREGIKQRVSVVDRLLAVHQPEPPAPKNRRSSPPQRRLKRYREE